MQTGLLFLTGGPLYKSNPRDVSVWVDDVIRANEIFADLSAMDALEDEMDELLKLLYEAFKNIVEGEIL